MSLGYAVLFSMHEQGMPLVMSVVYDKYAKPDGVEALIDKAIEITGVLDPVRYTRESYVVVDLDLLHHEIALGMVEQDRKDLIRDIAPEIYVWAMNQNTGNGGSMIRRTVGWHQQNINRKYWETFF